MLMPYYGALIEPRQVLAWAEYFVAGLDSKTSIAVIAHDLVVFNPKMTAVFWAVDVVAFEVEQVVIYVAVAVAQAAVCIDVVICVLHTKIVTHNAVRGCKNSHMPQSVMPGFAAAQSGAKALGGVYVCGRFGAKPLQQG